MMEYSEELVMSAATKAAADLGYTALKPYQKLVVKHFVRGSDVFVSMPTGSGKSLCYCLLPRVFNILRKKPSIVVVVSPLIALMKDQVSMEQQCIVLEHGV